MMITMIIKITTNQLIALIILDIGAAYEQPHVARRRADLKPEAVGKVANREV